ncbi:MAG: helix-turn-helix domain-containing protein [archaeon]
MKPEILMKFGLTRNEAIIYLTLIKIGESKVSKIIKESKFKSGKIYQVLDSLTNKGIISFVIKNNIKYYIPQNPKKISDYIKQKKLSIEQEESAFLKQLPELEEEFNSKKESCNVKVYESIEGIRSALFSFIEQLDKKSIIYLYGANDSKERDIVLLWPKYMDLTKKKGIKTKVIMTSITKEGKEKRKGKSFKNYDKEYRYHKGTDKSNFMVCGNITLLFNFDEPNCIFIENISYSQQFKELFDSLWKQAKK